MVDAAAKPHALVLKVMRLAKPKFFEPPIMGVDPADEFASDIQTALYQHTGQASMEIPLSDFVLAPQSIDNIYLGETFTFYMAVLNTSENDVCTSLSVQAHIQTQTQKIPLVSKFQESKLDPKQSIGQNIFHEIKEVGQHILVCEVNYKLNNADEMSLRKYFKFPVEKPLDVRTKFFSTEDNLSNDVYLEAQIQNLCNSFIVLEKVDLQTSEFYRRNDSGIRNLKDRQTSIQLNPQDIYQFLFCLSPNTSEFSLTQFCGVSPIGKLDISWRSSLGEAGRLQTSQLSKTTPTYGGDLRLIIDKVPGQVQLKQLFQVECRVLNCSERSLDLMLTLDTKNKRPFLFASVSGIHLGQLLPNSHAKFQLEVLPLQKGIQTLSGVRITDTRF
ncbi:hypothetical protein M3Y97_00743900 [Aphelenchoides bicaudatus]|nr:hypothetical protein M3Y97_00743900 [Aphelenchoides bicaudatus]